MSIRNMYRAFALQWLCFLLVPGTSPAQNVLCQATTLNDFFACYGGQGAFSAHSVAALNTFIQAEEAVQAGEYAEARELVDRLFATYPKGNNVWWNLFNDPNGANVGTPHAYYGLRMLEDVIDHGLHGNPNVQAKKVNMKVVLVGCSKGIQPTTVSELQNGTGPFVEHAIDSGIEQDDYRIIRQSLQLFTKYVTAITKGALEVNVEVIELDTLCLPVRVSITSPHLAYSTIEPVWQALTPACKDSTDWWWIMYPSHVPEFPVFDNIAFITGGMGADNKGGPVFISDDKWIVRKPAHLGKGIYSDIERRIYLPQWLQHEFFHHLYRIYPELALEVNGHDWFNQAFWPPDFEGQFETDYYSESLHKRLQLNCAPLATRLITRVQNDLTDKFSTFSMQELVGAYSLDLIQNAWHEASIVEQGGKYYWKNKANVQWQVVPNFASGRLETGSDCPYPGQDFLIQLYQTVEGDIIPGAVALKFNGEPYKKRFDLIRGIVPIEIALGSFERVPSLSTQHTGNITKTAGRFYWTNGANDSWSLVPNTDETCLRLNSDSPTPGEKFQLILTEIGCGTFALGFKYLGHYYWKPKRVPTNGSPQVRNPIADLELQENFGTYALNLSKVFEDPEGDSLMLFVSSAESARISAEINGRQLLLSGSQAGKTTIFLMALDTHGGLAVDEFDVEVKQTSSDKEEQSPERRISVFPRLTPDHVHVLGATDTQHITLSSVDQSYRQVLPVTGTKTSIDLGHLPSGVYLLLIGDAKHGTTQVEKVIKY